MKKSAQRRRKHCAPSRAKKFRPAADPLPVGAGRPKFNQLKMVTIFTYKPSLVRIDARNFELSWYQIHPHTNTHTHTLTHRLDRLQYTAPQLALGVISAPLWRNYVSLSVIMSIVCSG